MTLYGANEISTTSEFIYEAFKPSLALSIGILLGYFGGL